MVKMGFRVVLIVGALALASCSTTSRGNGAQAGPSPETPPPADKPACLPAASASVPAEPAPPVGISAQRLASAMITAAPDQATGLALWEWFTVTYPAWARGLHKRLTTVHEGC